MRPAGEQSDAHQRQPLRLRKHAVGEPRILHARALAPDGIAFSLLPVEKEQIVQLPFRRLRRAVEHGEVFLAERLRLHLRGEPRRRILRPGIDHHAAGRLIEPMHRKDRSAEPLLQQGRHGVFRISL